MEVQKSKDYITHNPYEKSILSLMEKKQAANYWAEKRQFAQTPTCTKKEKDGANSIRMVFIMLVYRKRNPFWGSVLFPLIDLQS